MLELKSEAMRKSEVGQNSLEQRCARCSIERNTKARKLWDKAPDILMLRLGLQKALGNKMGIGEEEVARNTLENTLGSILMDKFLGKSMEWLDVAEEAVVENSSLCRIWESIYMVCDKVKNIPEGKERISVMYGNFIVHFNALTKEKLLGYARIGNSCVAHRTVTTGN